MIKKRKDLFQVSKNNKENCYHRITATLLNQWQRIFDVEEEVFENENDTMCWEDKVEEEREKRLKEFLDVLERKPIPDNEYMKQGREFEDFVCQGLDEEFSPKVKNGAFQVTVTKNVEIDGEKICLYGILDVLKKGRIMDIKRIAKKYRYPKYKKSHQHPMYLELVPEAIDFTYLIFDGKNYHYENYIRENCENILETIKVFLQWLKANDYINIYYENWKMKK